MKKILLTIMCVIGMTTARAYDYTYLVFQTESGQATSVDVNDLTITINGTSLVVTNGSGTQTFTLSDLSKMYFSNTAGISELTNDESQEVEVFTPSGMSMGRFENLLSAQKQLEKGVYIVKSDNRTSKIIVK